MNRVAVAVLALTCLTITAERASAATRYDPRLRFRTIATPRFDIHYHQGEEVLAQRLAILAEQVAAQIDRTLGKATGRVQVILVDQNDTPNGWATPLPYNTIEITAAAPAADSIIGNVNDWLRLVFTHEYVHIVHLSRAEGWVGGLRRVFGRLPLLYPNLYQPIWQIEGLATWQESAQTGQGRVPAGDFRLFLERAAAQKRFEPLDRASSRLVDWPSGSTPYLYGAYFHEYLAGRYGEAAIGRLIDETSRRLPYLGSRAYGRVFGRSLGTLWEDFRRSVPPARVSAATARRLTRHGFSVSGPRFVDDRRVLYSLADPHGFPSLRELDLTTLRSRPIATRFSGDQVAIAGSDAIFDQIEVVRNVGRQSDLYATTLPGGDTRRLTYGARAADPDVSPDGSRIVFSVQHADRRELALAMLPLNRHSNMRALVSAADVDYDSPRWSPDGRSIVAERRARGAPSEIVIVDAQTAAMETIVSADRNAGPVWSPDGSSIWFASAPEREAFQIFSVDRVSGVVQQLEGTGPSAHSPAVSPDGRSLVFVGYTADGYDLFSLPLASARWTAVQAVARPAAMPRVIESTPAPSKPYGPLWTALPRFWTPTFESDGAEFVAGAATGSVDALGRHAYGVEAGWSTSRARPDWQVGYAYDRWQPTFYVVFADDTDPWREGERRTLEASAGMLLASRRIRRTHVALLEVHGSQERYECPSLAADCAPETGPRVGRRSIRTGLSYDSARAFGYSITPEEGGRITTTLEAFRFSVFGGASSLSATLDGRRYVRAWPRHAAVAMRAAVAAAWGDASVLPLFSASGSEPQDGGFGFGSGAIGLIRGVDEDRVLGIRAAVINLDYRLPIAHVERGFGTTPVFLKAVHAAVFVDAGTAWFDRFRSSDVRYSVGAELSIDTVLGFFAPVTFAAGGVWRVGPDPGERGLAAFARVGRAF
jgi:hypothetical protein